MKDRKRIYGPEISLSLPQPAKQPRTPNEMNKIHCQSTGTGILFEQGNIKLFIKCYKRFKNLNCSLKFSNFSLTKRKDYQQDDLEKQFSTYIHAALLPVIRMDLIKGIDLFVFVIESDGLMSTLSASITASSISLAHNQVPMLSLVAATSSSMVTVTKDGNDASEMVLSITKDQKVTFMVQFQQTLNTTQMINDLTDAAMQLLQAIEQIVINL